MARRSRFYGFVKVALTSGLAALAPLSAAPQVNQPNATRQQTPTQTTPPAPRQPPPQEGEADEVVRVTTDLVTLPVSVVDRQGRYVTDLVSKDFRVYEGDDEQTIAHFGSVDRPFDVILLLDTSGSTAPYLDNMKIAARSFLEQLRPADGIDVVTFDGRIRSLNAAAESDDRMTLSAGIDTIKTGSSDIGTRLYDAVDLALRAPLGRERRRAIVLFTDGTNTWGKATEKSTLRQAEGSDVQIFTVRYGTEPTEKYLRALAEMTGGRYLLTEAGDQSLLKGVFAAIAAELRQQYSIGYYRQPTPDGDEGSLRPEQRRIKIKVRRPNLSVRTKVTPTTDDAK